MRKKIISSLVATLLILSFLLMILGSISLGKNSIETCSCDRPIECSILIADNTKVFEINNAEDIVWQWHSGMEGAEGWIQYTNGKNVINDTIDYHHVADSLDEGHYYWAVWGWGGSGVRVWYSSRELEFYVLN